MTSKNKNWVRTIVAAGVAALSISGVASDANAWGSWGAWVAGASPTMASCTDGVNPCTTQTCNFLTTGVSYYLSSARNSLRAFAPGLSDNGGTNAYAKTQAQGYPLVSGAYPTVTACIGYGSTPPLECGPTSGGTAMKTVPVSLTQTRCRIQVVNNINGGDI